MTPSRDNRAGNVVVCVTQWSDSFVRILQDGGPKAYSNVKLKENIPPEVLAAGTSYWNATIGDGHIKFHNQVTIGEWKVANDSFVFDDDGEVQYDLLVERLIEKVELDLRDPDKYRFNGLNDAQWEEIKRLAHEQINGRG